MRWVFFVFMLLVKPFPLSAQSTTLAHSAEDLETIVVQTSEILSGITDRESAKLAESDFDIWRKSPFISDDTSIAIAIREAIDESESLASALTRQSEQLDRIEAIDPDLLDYVLELMTGTKPIKIDVQFHALAEVLKTIKDSKTLETSAPELEEIGAPLFPLPSHGVDDLQNTIKYQEDLAPALKDSMENFLSEVARIDGISRELGLGVRRIISAPNIEAMEAHAKQLPQLKTRATAISLKTALLTFFVEYRRFPFPPAETETVHSADGKLHHILSGNNAYVNPRNIGFLTLPKGGDASTGGIEDWWENPFRVIYDANNDNQLVIPRPNGEQTVVKFTRIGVESAGPDGDFETTDDNVNSWDRSTE